MHIVVDCLITLPGSWLLKECLRAEQAVVEDDRRLAKP